MNIKKYDVIIIGGGAAGLMCGGTLIKKNISVAIIEKSEKLGKKILISGGGRCNFTNLYIEPEAYISPNPHFCKSALSGYTQWEFISLMEKHNLTWNEKNPESGLGQLFCDKKSIAIRDMLVSECDGADFYLQTNIENIQFKDDYLIQTETELLQTKSLIIATGGESIPKMGATDFGLKIAKQFGIKTIPFTPALVPFIFNQNDLKRYFEDLSGTAFFAEVSCNNQAFKEMVLITHKGLSGPAILQISSYWSFGDEIKINLLPNIDAQIWLLKMQQVNGKSLLKNILSEFLNKKFSEKLVDSLINKNLADKTLGEINQADLKLFANTLNNWCLSPSGTRGMSLAEVCTGGVSVDEISSKTFEAKNQKGLYFIGETLDIAGWLGGYNFQWAWASGVACGIGIADEG